MKQNKRKKKGKQYIPQNFVVKKGTIFMRKAKTFEIQKSVEAPV